MKVFMGKLLCEPPDCEWVHLNAPIQKNKAKTCILCCIHAHMETSDSCGGVRYRRASSTSSTL